MLLKLDDTDLNEISKLTDFYRVNLKGSNAIEYAKDYALLAYCLMRIYSKIDFSGHHSRKEKNKTIVRQYGFASFDALLDYLINQLNELNIHAFKIRNKRKFTEKLNSFIALKPPSPEALLSLVSKKYGKANYSKWSPEHQKLLSSFLSQKRTNNLNDLTDGLNLEFEFHGLKKISYETIKVKARKTILITN